MRVEYLETQIAVLAREMLRIALHLPLRFVLIRIHVSDMHLTSAELECLLHRFCDSRARAPFHNVAIHNDFDRMFAAVVDRRWLVDGVAFAINAHPRVS